MESYIFGNGVKHHENSWRRDSIQAVPYFLTESEVLTPHSDHRHWLVVHDIYVRLTLTNSMKQLFWGIPAIESMAFPQFLDLFRSGVMYLATIKLEKELIGVGLLSDIFGQHRVNLGIWLEPKMRGVNSHHVGRQLLAYTHGRLGFYYVYATTPWQSGKSFCERMGFHPVAELPAYCNFKGREQDVAVFMSDRRSFYRSLIEDFQAQGWSEESSINYANSSMAQLNGEI